MLHQPINLADQLIARINGAATCIEVRDLVVENGRKLPSVDHARVIRAAGDRTRALLEERDREIRRAIDVMHANARAA